VEDSRRDRDREIAGAEREIDALYRGLQKAVGESIRRHGEGGTLGAAGYVAVMRDVDAALEAVYGRYRGDADAALGLTVTRRATRARVAALRRNLGMVKRA
jgi:hypothetical protein